MVKQISLFANLNDLNVHIRVKILICQDVFLNLVVLSCIFSKEACTCRS